MFRAFLMSIGRAFHNEAAAVSIRRPPYFTVRFLLGVISVSFTDRSCLLGWYRFTKFCMYSGASSCKDLKVIVNNLNWQRFITGSQCSCLKIGVMCARSGGFLHYTRCCIMCQLKLTNGVQWHSDKNTVTVIQPRYDHRFLCQMWANTVYSTEVHIHCSASIRYMFI